MTFDRATLSVVVMMFTGIFRHWRARQQGRFFCPCQFERLLEALDLPDLAPQEPLEFPCMFFKPAQFRRRDNPVVGANSLLAPCSSIASNGTPSWATARGAGQHN
jgi:hypothetical protein